MSQQLSLQYLISPVKKYANIVDVFASIDAARGHQFSEWPQTAATDAGDRPTEEWIVLLQHYQNKLLAVYSESDGNSVEGRARVAKYAAIIANLSFWLVQATLGPVVQDRAAALAAANIVEQPTVTALPVALDKKPIVRKKKGRR